MNDSNYNENNSYFGGAGCFGFLSIYSFDFNFLLLMKEVKK